MNRLRWKCRRGMLELDLMLNAFLDNGEDGYASLDDTDREVFRTILEYPDNMLLELLMGRMQASEPAVNHVIQRICQTTHSAT